MDCSPSAPRSAQTAGVVALLIAAALWSLNGPLIKLAGQDGGDGGGASGIAIACYRSLIGGAFFIIPAWLRRETLASVAPVWPAASVAAFTLMTVCFVVATTLTAASSAIILQYISPIIVFLLAPMVLGERPRWREGAVLSLAMVGVAIIFLGQGERGSIGPLLLAAVAGVGYGTLTVLLRKLRAVDAAVVVALNFMGSGLLLLPVMLLTGSAKVSGSQLGIIALMSVVQFALPYAIFQWGIQRVEAHRASLIVLLEPVLNAILTWAIVGESIPAPTLIGGPVILLSVLAWICMGLKPSRAREQASPDPGAT